MKLSIAALPGDGIGPEVCAQAERVLRATCERFGHELIVREAQIGGEAIDTTGDPLPPATLEACRASEAVLLGAVGGPRWSDPSAPVRPEQGLLRLRAELGVFANLRPVRAWPELPTRSPLRDEVTRGADVLFVRELTGGIYFGAKGRERDRAFDECAYTVPEVERVVRVAAGLARGRSGRLTSVDKANVLETSRLWRETAARVVAEEFPDVTLEHQLVDAMALHLLTRPRDFDVVVTENLFGDVLTDEAAALVGSLGLAPSASLGAGRRGLYEPIHGSAPDLAGRDAANPVGAILSAALLLRHTFELTAEARAVEGAVEAVLSRGVCTADVTPSDVSRAGTRSARCSEVGEAIALEVLRPEGDWLVGAAVHGSRWEHG